APSQYHTIRLSFFFPLFPFLFLVRPHFFCDPFSFSHKKIMVNWQNPNTTVAEYVAWVKLLHVINGVYIWEFICNLNFELSLIRGRRQWRWTASFYIACRLATIAELFAYGAGTLSLSLYAIRSIAVWQRSIVVTTFSTAIILANFGASFRQAKWDPKTNSCVRPRDTKALLINALLLATELIFIALMAGGIYYRNRESRAFKVMYREGLLWLISAALVQTVPVASILCPSIGATRMYRTLSDRQAGNLLDFWEASQDEITGEIRFRRQTQFVTRTDGQTTDMASSTALPMGRLMRSPPQSNGRYVERFEVRDIELDDESLRDSAKRSIATEDTGKSETDWVAHAK
ncbi:hypothetical protein BGW80DRAFT_1301110, partial [Lactifluus volemus]